MRSPRTWIVVVIAAFFGVACSSGGEDHAKNDNKDRTASASPSASEKPGPKIEDENTDKESDFDDGIRNAWYGCNKTTCSKQRKPHLYWTRKIYREVRVDDATMITYIMVKGANNVPDDILQDLPRWFQNMADDPDSEYDWKLTDAETNKSVRIPTKKRRTSIAMPDVVGETANSAVARIADAGFPYGQVNVESDNGKIVVLYGNWTVIAQSVSPGDSVSTKDFITLTVTK